MPPHPSSPSAPHNLMSRIDILSLYRSLIYHGKRFPSRSRSKIVEGIRADFRDHKNLTDKNEHERNKLRIELARALDGLQQLKAYTSLSSHTPHWTVDLQKTQPKGAGRINTATAAAAAPSPSPQQPGIQHSIPPSNPSSVNIPQTQRKLSNRERAQLEWNRTAPSS